MNRITCTLYSYFFKNLLPVREPKKYGPVRNMITEHTQEVFPVVLLQKWIFKVMKAALYCELPPYK